MSLLYTYHPITFSEWLTLLCDRRLLEKYSQYQEQAAQLQTQEGEGEGEREEEEEMEDILTPDEKDKAERVKKTINKCVVF